MDAPCVLEGSVCLEGLAAAEIVATIIPSDTEVCSVGIGLE